MKEVKQITHLQAIGPYSQAIISGNTVFASGQIPVNPANGEIPEGVEAQANQAFTNVKICLKRQAQNIDKGYKNNRIHSEYGRFRQNKRNLRIAFTEPFPARSCVEVAKLLKGVLLEVEAIAEL